MSEGLADIKQASRQAARQGTPDKQNMAEQAEAWRSIRQVKAKASCARQHEGQRNASKHHADQPASLPALHTWQPSAPCKQTLPCNVLINNHLQSMLQKGRFYPPDMQY